MTTVLNARILAGLGMIVFAAALIVGGTGAFFSDEETSTGNTFTAGALDLKIDSVAHYNGMVCALDGEDYIWVPNASAPLDPLTMQPVLAEDMNDQAEWDAYNLANPLQYPEAGTPCTGTWPLADLGEGELAVGTFFDFDDIKPGDEGENTISIHIDNNDAWMCASIGNIGEADNTQTEPEAAVDGDGLASGELDDNLWFFAWLDDGDNTYEPGELIGETDVAETALGNPISASELATTTWALADGGTLNGPIEGGSTNYIGLYWCAGTIDTNGGAGPLTCDGEAMGNIAQTDSWNADLTFYIEQSRNNADFRCTPPTTEPETATITVDKIVSFTSASIAGVDVPDFTLTIQRDGGGAPIVVTDQVAMPGLEPGTYTITEVYSNDPAGITFDAQFSGSCSEIGTSGEGTMTVAAGESLTCVITNFVSPGQVQQDLIIPPTT